MESNRYIAAPLEELCFTANKMAFVSGPRQAGKTTMAKQLLKMRGVGNYCNWDDIKFRRLWTKDPAQIVPEYQSKVKPLIILDEIHKARYWKRNLKGVYDTLDCPCDILVTGSAKLNVYRKGSDSLLGRYYHFRLHPFSLAEMLRLGDPIAPENILDYLFDASFIIRKKSHEILTQLMRYGPFPEPLFSQSSRRLKLWQRNRIERLIREDLRDISRLTELSQVEMLASLLPERVASPLSIQSLSEDLEVAYNTVKHWITYLRELYYLFDVKPFTNSLPRSIKKEGKLFLWDWSEVEDQAARFENLIASHLLKCCHYFTDAGYGKFELRYVRNKEKKEIDFLLLKDKKPWFPVEVKLNDEQPSSNWNALMKHLQCSRAVQVTMKKNVFKRIKQDGYDLLIISADQFLYYLV